MLSFDLWLYAFKNPHFSMQLSDFGLAVKASGVNGNADVELLGTLGYVAPEYMLDGMLLQ